MLGAGAKWADERDPAPGLQQLGLDWNLMSSEACMSRLLVQATPVLAFRLLEYYTPSKRILKKTMLSTWTLKKLTKGGVSIRQKKRGEIQCFK